MEQPEYGAMGFDGSFNFTCGAHLSCYLACCTGVKVWLYPYDVLCLSRQLDLSTTEFLSRHTYCLESPPVGYPVVVLQRGEDGEGRCTFAADSGCMVYPARPWICRLFPVMPEECRLETTPEANRSFNILVWEGCRGVGNGPAVTVREWWQRAGLTIYEENHLGWQRLVDKLGAAGRLPLMPVEAELFKLAYYDFDRFRELLLAGELPNPVNISASDSQLVATDDLVLQKTACCWLAQELLGYVL